MMVSLSISYIERHIWTLYDEMVLGASGETKMATGKLKDDLSG